MNSKNLNKRSKKISSLGAVLNQLIEAYDFNDKIKESQIFYMWSEIVGEPVAKVTTPLRVKDGILYLKVKNDAWRNELYYQKLSMIYNIENHLKKKLITEIILV